MKKVFLNALQQTFPGTPNAVLQRMVKDCEKTEKKYSESAKFSFSIKPRKLTSFEDIVEAADLSGYNERYTNVTIKEKLFSEPLTTEVEEIVLVYTGGTPFYGTNGYIAIENAHPSLLIEAMKVLKGKKLTEIGIPHYVRYIVLPTYTESFTNEYGKSCFASVAVDGTYRKLSFTNASATGNVYAMLLRKVP
jgi:hypothetical protein